MRRRLHFSYTWSQLDASSPPFTSCSIYYLVAEMRLCPVISLTVWDNADLRMTLTLRLRLWHCCLCCYGREREEGRARGCALGEGGFQASLSLALKPWKREEGDILICGLCWSADPICSANMHYKNIFTSSEYNRGTCVKETSQRYQQFLIVCLSPVSY